MSAACGTLISTCICESGLYSLQNQIRHFNNKLAQVGVSAYMLNTYLIGCIILDPCIACWVPT
jgi:hypothetical protein